MARLPWMQPLVPLMEPIGRHRIDFAVRISMPAVDRRHFNVRLVLQAWREGPTPETTPLPGGLQGKVSPALKLMLCGSMRPDR